MCVQSAKLQELPPSFFSSELASLKSCLVEPVPAVHSMDVDFDFVRC